MKLKYLWVSKYKNIENLEFEFKSDLVTLLVGRNGLGKSNLIEILALIFRDLDLLNKPDDYNNWAYNPDHFEYKLQYECKNSEITINCDEGNFQVNRRQIKSDGAFQKISITNFIKDKKEEYLPKYIIGYYSGENKRIREVIRPYEEIIWNNLKNNLGMENGFRQMFFAENHHANIILLTLLLYKFHAPNSKFEERILYLVENFASFSKLEKFDVHLKNPSWFKRTGNDIPEKSIENIESNILAKKTVEYPFWNAKGKAHKIISFLYDNNKALPTYYYEPDDKFEHLLLSLDKDKVATKVFKEFGHPSKFLDAFEVLYIIDAIYHISLSVKSVERNVEFAFSELSEGEQQLIAVLGLILLTGQDDCLFLLDEPDTHLNPAWQRDYVSLLKKFNLNDENSHIILSTHSPLLVQAATDETDIFIFKSDKNGQIKVDYHDFKIPNWRIDHVLLSEYFGLESTRPKSADEFIRKRKAIIAKGKLTEKDLEKLKEYENELGYLPTGETIEELEDKVFLRKKIKSLRNNE